ncbi:MAG: hypothetical protein JSV12_01575 [Candidatus Bathyarchaeota archaeon]|nr:MAG: hypothetical protein JSV12_01575 [Candidatus Bathyarchaeota archaeon]
MPSIASNHLYTFIAMTAVSTLLIVSFSIYASTVRTIPKIEQLKNILDHVAAKANELLTLVTATNSTIQTLIQLPTTIGQQGYWIKIRNDTSNAWVEGALGEIREDETEYRVFFPKNVRASGNYLGGYGPATLECYMNGSIPQLNLDSVGG